MVLNAVEGSVKCYSGKSYGDILLLGMVGGYNSHFIQIKLCNIGVLRINKEGQV